MRRRQSMVATLVLALAAAQARRSRVAPLEAPAFRLVNRRSDIWQVPLWIIMQGGSLGAVWVSAALVGVGRDRRAALRVAAVGTSVWGGVKLVKRGVGRERPAMLLSGVMIRGRPQSGLGFPSGHAAVSVSNALLVPWRSDTQRLVALAGAGIVGMSRMYVGAHLPLDVVGGFAIGSIAGAVAQRT